MTGKEIATNVFKEYNKLFDILPDGTLTLHLTEYLFLDVVNEDYMQITIFINGGYLTITNQYLITTQRIQSLKDLQGILKW